MPHSLPRFVRRWFGLALAALTSGAIASDLTLYSPATDVRIIVEKTLDLSASDDKGIRAMKFAVLRAAGLKHVAEYASYDVFKGNPALAEKAIGTLKSNAISCRRAYELDTITIANSEFDPVTGRPVYQELQRTYTPTGDVGLYVLTFDSFPLSAWLQEIGQLGVLILDPLPPASYIVRGNRQLVEGLPASLEYVLGAFPLTPDIKTAPISAAADPGVYRSMVIDAVEATDEETILPFLQSVAENGAVYEAERLGVRVRYTAKLADVDVQTLAAFESVFTISSGAGAEISSEREGGIARLAEPSWSLPLPAPSPSYTGWLSGKGLGSFPNTIVGLVDTGFDTTGMGNHPDFTSTGTAGGTPFVSTTYLVNGNVQRDFNQATADPNVDNISHGTVSTSVVSGYQPDSTARKDQNGYRYALGVAPKVATVMDKFFSRTGTYPKLPVDFTIVYNRLDEALQKLWFNGHANVINNSWNDQDGVAGCKYEDISQLLDKRTRLNNVLYVVSAGNILAGCPYVRAPANAKNAIAVGATEIQTPSSWANKMNLVPNKPVVAECNWNDYPGTGVGALDPRNQPSFSGRARSVGTVLTKPDLVASGLRITGPLSRDPAWQVDNGVFCNPLIADFSASDGVKYGFSAGTSFAAPAVSGAAAVVRQWYRNSLAGTDPSPAMTKAILINGARDTQSGDFRKIFPYVHVGYAGYIPDQFQGYGMLSFARILNSAAGYYWFDQGLTFVPGQSLTWTVSKPVVSGTSGIRVTLVYTDRFSSTLNTDQYKIVNDLDLKVCNAANTACWYGNKLVNGVSEQRTPSNPFSDNVNNVEIVVIPAGAIPAGQQAVVTVTARSLMSDALNPGNPDGTNPRQDFALFASNIH